MELNADFGARASVHAGAIEWSASPMPGVERKMLDRIGSEVARATTIVRFAPGSSFSPHIHDGGEEFLVLEGVFQDEHGDFPAGSYIRNPPTSRHTPASAPGCTILVKLWQFDLDDRSHVRVDTTKSEALPDPHRPGVTLTPLFRDSRETVRIEHWEANASVPLGDAGGAEYFVIEGGFEECGEAFSARSWLRLPMGAATVAHIGGTGATVWVKTGHLPFVQVPKA